MDKTSVYNFLHKQIRNAVPGKPRQRRYIETLRRAFFPELLAEIYSDLETCTAEGTADKTILAPGGALPPSRLRCTTGPIPLALTPPTGMEPEAACYTLHQGCCFRSFVLDRRRRFIRDATPPALFRSDLLRNNKDIRALRARHIDDDAVALNTSHTDNYFHWFADLVGRLLLLPNFADKLICTDQRFPYQRETLRLLGIPTSRILPISDYSLYRFRTLTVLGASPGPLSHSLRALQAWAGTAAPDTSAPKRLYISRRDTPGRRNILNERDMLPLLREYGFQAADFAEISIAQKIAMLRNADMVAFPQGAAVINMAFCRPETRFFEVYSPVLFDGTGINISTALGLEHHILIGKNAGPGSPQTAGYSVDLEELRVGLKAFVDTPAHIDSAPGYSGDSVPQSPAPHCRQVGV